MGARYAWCVEKQTREPVHGGKVDTEAAQPMRVMVCPAHGGHGGCRSCHEYRKQVHAGLQRQAGPSSAVKSVHMSACVASQRHVAMHGAMVMRGTPCLLNGGQIELF